MKPSKEPLTTPLAENVLKCLNFDDNLSFSKRGQWIRLLNLGYRLYFAYSYDLVLLLGNFDLSFLVYNFQISILMITVTDSLGKGLFINYDTNWRVRKVS